MAAFCREQRLSYAQTMYWQRRLGTEGTRAGADTGGEGRSASAGESASTAVGTPT